ncbi:polyol transporter 5-like [Dendrobium catenatum]|uniref:Polyol transporter 5 n=1 Tax=Dendrobium catenatum TaxID=906689 RepID=A0A2I0XGP9_9ASPA|nr:polyol transporter 5-like [Dendrobium catenatum]PKU87085.1 Polyol transporter 5 [Dendrobium catenatum]
MDSEKIMLESSSGKRPAIIEAPKKPAKNSYALICSLLASMTSVVLGYDLAVMTGASLFIQDDLKISDTELEILAGIISFYSLIGSLAAGRTSDWIGRRYTMLMATTIFFTGSILMGSATNYAFLMCGRFVAGIGVGYALMIAPVYTAEISPASARGFLATFPEIFINVGVLSGYISNFALSGLPEHISWRVMFLVGAIPPILIFAGVLIVMPESPRWLVMQGRLEEAAAVLAKTSDSPEEAALRLEEIKSAAADEEHGHGKGVWRELLLRPTPVVRRIVIAAVGIHFFQQASGMDTVGLYSPRIFEKAGITGRQKKLGASVAMGFIKTIFILVATFFLDRVGRRPLLLISAGGMILSFLALASTLLAIDRRGEGEKSKAALGVSIAAVLSLMASFSIGLGPITWVYSSEIFPLRLRAQGVSLGAGTNRVISGVLTMSFISLYKAISISGTFFLDAGIAMIGWFFFYFFLPETKGRSLEEMEKLFGKKGKQEGKVEA